MLIRLGLMEEINCVMPKSGTYDMKYVGYEMMVF